MLMDDDLKGNRVASHGLNGGVVDLNSIPFAAIERVETLNNLANALIELKDFSQAVKVAEQAATKAPNSPLVIDTLGWALFNAGQTDRALQLLRDARLRAPDNAEIRTHLAIALHKLGRKQEAAQEAKAALRLAPNFPGAEAARRIAQD